MLFYVQMKWNYQGVMDQETLWRRQSQEATFSLGPEGDRFIKVIWIYKVASQHRVIAVVEAQNADDLDRNAMFALPMGDMLEFEHCWPLREYTSFMDDVNNRHEKFK